MHKEVGREKVSREMIETGKCAREGGQGNSQNGENVYEKVGREKVGREKVGREKLKMGEESLLWQREPQQHQGL